MQKPNTMGIVRLIMYVISALVGIGAVVTGTLEMNELSQVLGVAAGAGASITGGTAAFNLPKAPDQSKTGGMDFTQLVPAVLEISQAARKYSDAMTYEGMHRATSETTPHTTADDGEGVFSALQK